MIKNKGIGVNRVSSKILVYAKPLVVMGVSLSLSALADEPNAKSPDNQAIAANPTKPESSGEVEAIEVRYARAHLEMAELDVERALAWNQRIPNLFNDRELDNLRKHVVVNQEQLKQSLRGYDSSVYQVVLRTAEATLKACESEVARRKSRYQEMPNRFNALELDHAQVQLKVAKLNLQRTRLQKDSVSTIAFLQWQIDELRNQLMETQLRIEKITRE